MVKKVLLHCEEMLDWVEWQRKEKQGASIWDLVGFYMPEIPTGFRGWLFRRGLIEPSWEVKCLDGGYTAHSQFEAEVISSLEQIKALLLKQEGKLK